MNSKFCVGARVKLINLLREPNGDFNYNQSPSNTVGNIGTVVDSGHIPTRIRVEWDGVNSTNSYLPHNLLRIEVNDDIRPSGGQDE